MLNIKFADDWIRTADLWCQMRQLYQQSHNRSSFTSILQSHKSHRIFGRLYLKKLLPNLVTLEVGKIAESGFSKQALSSKYVMTSWIKSEMKGLIFIFSSCFVCCRFMFGLFREFSISTYLLLTSCLSNLYSVILLVLKITTYLLVRLNPNQSNGRSVVLSK